MDSFQTPTSRGRPARSPVSPVRAVSPSPERPRKARLLAPLSHAADSVADLWMSLAVAWESTVPDLSNLGVPAGMLCNAALLACRMAEARMGGDGSDAVQPPQLEIPDWLGSTSLRPVVGLLLASFHHTNLKTIAAIHFGLLLISLVNTIVLFASSKRYDLRPDPEPAPIIPGTPYRPAIPQTPKSPNIRPASIPAPDSPAPRRTLFSLLRKAEPPKTLPMLALSLWTPPAFSLAFFCTFSPVPVLLSFFLPPSIQLLVPLLVLSAASNHALSSAYSQHVRDKQILFESVWKEYDQGFVVKRLGVRKESKAVQVGIDMPVEPREPRRAVAEDEVEVIEREEAPPKRRNRRIIEVEPEDEDIVEILPEVSSVSARSTAAAAAPKTTNRWPPAHKKTTPAQQKLAFGVGSSSSTTSTGATTVSAASDASTLVGSKVLSPRENRPDGERVEKEKDKKKERERDRERAGDRRDRERSKEQSPEHRRKDQPSTANGLIPVGRTLSLSSTKRLGSS